ncbi:MAG: hypothetical protein Q9170_003553 [Blastenia crenularia]
MDKTYQRSNDALAIAKSTLNESQGAVLDKLGHIEGNVLATPGPPGTGKTRVLTHMIWLLMFVGYKVLALAHSNAATDNLAIKTKLESLNQKVSKELMRLEIASVEKTAILNEAVEAIESLDVSEDPRVAVTYGDFVREKAAVEKFRVLRVLYEQYERDYKQVQDFEKLAFKVTVVPFKTTMGGHLQEFMHKDKAESALAFNKEFTRRV